MYVWGGVGNDSIEPIIRLNGVISFFFKKLQYRLRGSLHTPVGYDYEENFSQFNSSYLAKGLNNEAVVNSMGEFGKNEHPV